MLSGWGVTADKDLLLDANPLSQLVGLDATVPLVTNYESHAIVNDMQGTATGFPLSRSLGYQEWRQDLGHETVFNFRQQLTQPPI